MPPTKTPLSPEAEPPHANGDEDAKRSARSYRTYDDEEDRYTPYSDDNFESDYDRNDTRKKSGGTYTGKQGAKRSDGSKVHGSKALRHFAAASRSRPSPGSRDNVAQRVLSARRLKMNELKNEIELLSKDLFEMKKENVLLRRTQVIQERSLERFEDKESNLPQLIEGHSREVRALREQLRKHKESGERARRAARDLEDDLAQARKQLRKLQALVDDRGLAERDDLSRRVEELEASVDAKTDRVKELERHVENLEKNHGRELRAEMKKVKEARAENELLQQSVEKLQLQLKEKEKELEIANIYHGRLAKAQQRSLPALDAPPSPRPPPYNRRAHTPDASPRDKARQLDEKRREAMKKRRESGEKALALVKVAASDPPKGLPPQPHHQEQRKAERPPARADAADASATEREDSWEKIRLEQERIDAQKRAAARPATPPHADVDERRGGVPSRRPAQHQQTAEDRLSREAKEEAERRERAAAEQREADARQERERWEREERRRREQEREEREREERERRLQLERREKEQREEEERRARAREDEQRRITSDTAAAEERRKKDKLLQMMKNIDSNKDATSTGDDSVGSLTTESKTPGTKPTKKDYAFRDADQKLHQGIPAKPLRNSTTNLDEPFDKTKGSNQAETMGYAPSFDKRDAASKAANDPRSTQDKAGTAKKSKLLDNLFGPDSGKASSKGAFGDDDIFSSSTKAKPVADRRAYPWEVDADSNNSGKAKDEVVLMPLRQRLEPSAVHSKPTVKAVSATSFEDDIEELVL